MKVLKKLLLVFYRFFVRVNFFFGAAFILTILTKPLNKKGKYRVLSLIKPIFSDDLNEIKKVDSDLQFLSFPRLLLSEVVKKYAKDFLLLNDASYHPILDGTKEQEKIYSAIKKIFKHLQWMLKFDAIFSGNYVYVSQQELTKIATENNIPVIVLYKEGMFPKPISKEKSKKIYGGKKFVGSKILVYNTIIKKILLDAKIPGINSENLVTVGIPRLDGYTEKNNKCDKQYKNTITLFAFESKVKVQTAINEEEFKLPFVKRCNQFQKDLFEFCRINSNYKLVIKIKTTPDAIEDILNILGIKSKNELPKNIEITATTSPKKLIEDSKFIAGFFSTTLLEAMLLNKYIFTPSFNDIKENLIEDYFTNFKDVVNYAKSYDDFYNLFNNQKILVKASNEKRKQVLEKMFFAVDQKASERVVKIILQEIEKTI